MNYEQRRRCGLLLGILASAVALPFLALGQGSATLTCTPPTQNTDGSIITTPLSYRFRHGTVQGSYPDVRSAPGCALVWDGFAPGTHFFVATAVSAAGVESAFSNAASKVITAAPNPPSALTVQQDLTAYVINQSRNRIVLVGAGSIPSGTACDTTQQVLGKYVVDIAAVVWAGTVRSQVVFATCS